MEWPNLEEGTQILFYPKGWKFDAWGPGIVKKVETIKNTDGSKKEKERVEILFPHTLTIPQQLLPSDVFREGIATKQIEITENFTFHQWWRVRERELVNKPLADALEETKSFSGDELVNLIKLLKERVDGPRRLNREEAVLLLGAISELLHDEEEVRELFEFLLEQTKAGIKKRSAHPLSPRSLRVEAQFRREQFTTIAKCLEVSAEIARKKDDKEMASVVRETANGLQAHSSQILRRTAKAVLKNL